MQSSALFRQLDHQVSKKKDTVSITINGQEHRVESHLTVAAALLIKGPVAIRKNQVDGSLRGPYCMMGVCFECLVEVNGMPNVQSCMLKVADGMRIKTLGND